MQKTQTQQFAALAPADSLGARFCKYFSHPWGFIVAPTPPPGEKTQWATETAFPLQPRNLWQWHQSPDTLIGLRFGSETRYCAIDIDKASPYHPKTNYSAYMDVRAALEEIGLCRPLVVQSSWSGGLHLYYFLSQPLPTFDLACVIKFALEDVDLCLRQGELEAFPNVKAFSKHEPTNYNALRLPLQDGSYLLDDELQPLSNGVAYFLNAADVAAAHQDTSVLQESIAAAKKRHKIKFLPKSSSNGEAWKRHLEERISQGWTGAGQTNNLIHDFVAYGIVFQSLADTALIDFVETAAIAAPGYQQYCNHKHEIRSRVQDWVRCCEATNYYTPYCSYPERKGRLYKENSNRSRPQNNVVDFPLNRANESRAAQTQERIRQVIQELEASDKLPAGVRARAAAIVATAQVVTGTGISQSTLYKPAYLLLWHPEHLKQGVTALLEPVSASFSEGLDTTTKTPELSHINLLHPVTPYEGIGHLRARPFQGQALAELSSPPLNSLSLSPDWGEAVAAAAEVALPAAAVAEVVLPVAEVVLPIAEVLLPVAAAAEVVPAAELIRQTKIRLQANDKAQKAARNKSRSEGRILGKDERLLLEQSVKFQFYWESGEVFLMREAVKWASDNPGILPEASTAGLSAISEVVHSVSITLEVSPEVSPFKAGDQVALADPYMVASTFHGTVEGVAGDEIQVHWEERRGKFGEYEVRNVSELRLLLNSNSTSGG